MTNVGCLRESDTAKTQRKNTAAIFRDAQKQNGPAKAEPFRAHSMSVCFISRF
jgi:hypothetical protein